MNIAYVIGGLCGLALAVLVWGSIVYCAVNYNHIKEFLIGFTAVFVLLSAGVIVALNVVYKSVTE